MVEVLDFSTLMDHNTRMVHSRMRGNSDNEIQLLLLHSLLNQNQ